MLDRSYRAFVSFFHALGETIQSQQSYGFSDKKQQESSVNSKYFCSGVTYKVVDVYETFDYDKIIFYQSTNIGADCGLNITIFDECIKNVDDEISNSSEVKVLGPHNIKPSDTYPFAGEIDIYEKHGNGDVDAYTFCGYSTVISSNFPNLNPSLIAYFSQTLAIGMAPFKKEIGNPDCTDYILIAKILGGAFGSIAAIACLCYFVPKICAEKKEEGAVYQQLSDSAQLPEKSKSSGWCCARLFLKKNPETMKIVAKENKEQVQNDRLHPFEIVTHTEPHSNLPRQGARG